EAGGAIVKRRGVAGGHGAVLFEGRLEAGELFKTRIRPRSLVLVEAHPLRQGHRHQLVAKVAGLLRRDRPAVTVESPSILSLATDGVAAGDHLGSLSQTDRWVHLRQPWIDHATAQRDVVESLSPAGQLAVRSVQG